MFGGSWGAAISSRHREGFKNGLSLLLTHSGEAQNYAEFATTYLQQPFPHFFSLGVMGSNKDVQKVWRHGMAVL